jgi:hypothetical protein
MPALVVGAIVACADRRYALMTLAFATTFTVNCAFILVGFYGGAHHPLTLQLAHLCAAVNVATFLVLAATYFRTPVPLSADGLARPLRAAWR